MVQAIHYRVRQFLRALFARVSEDELGEALHVLSPEAQALFRRQAAQDQRHALTVCQALHEEGRTNPDLLAAALLHDVGKTAARLPAWQRAVIVLLGRFAPRLLARLSGGEPRGWRRPFVTHTLHPQAGARWAEQAGCSPLTVALIRRHEDRLADCQTEEDQLLAALQATDSAN